MKEPDGLQLRSIRWSDVFPWLALGRCFRLAIAPRMLIFGAVGTVINLFGWWILAWLCGSGGQSNPWFQQTFSRPIPGVESHDVTPLEIINRHVNYNPDTGYISGYLTALDIEKRAVAASHSLIEPFQSIFTLRKLNWNDRAFLILASLLTIAVWGFLGGAISRMAALQLAADEKVGLIQGLRWARRKWLSYCAAPLFPLLGVALAAIPLWFVGLLQQVDFGVLITGPFWFLALACGFFMALLLVGLAYGWPLMWATISVEGTDSFDALSRTYAYTLQRPVRYAWYIFVAAGLGFVGLIAVDAFAAAVLWMTTWGTSLGLGSERTLAIMQAANELKMPAGMYGVSIKMGVVAIAFWLLVVKCLAMGYVPAYFWTASTSIYLLLRRDVDATETDEVFLDADASEKAAPLPPITTDAVGAPQVVTQIAAPAIDGQPVQVDEPKAAE